MRVCWLPLLCLAWGCGQFGFDAVPADGAVGDTPPPDVVVDALLTDVPPVDSGVMDVGARDTTGDPGCMEGASRVIDDCGMDDLGALTEFCARGMWGTATCVETFAASHRGWVSVSVVGERQPVATAGALPARGQSLSLTWNAMGTTPEVPVDEYNVYRSTSRAGPFTRVGGAAAVEGGSSTYVDPASRRDETFFYVVRPVVRGVELETDEPDSVLEIPAPPSNMVLLHRWMVNLETCARLGAASDRGNDYRCAYTGPGRIGYAGDIGMPPPDESFFDIGGHRFVDTVETGCGYTLSSMGCPDGPGVPGPCLGTGGDAPDSPANAKGGQRQVGEEGDVFYDRGSSTCFYRNTTTWVAANSLSELDLAPISSNAPGLPPLVRVGQETANGICKSRGPQSFLVSRRTQVAAAAWSLMETAIGDMEAGETMGGCNSDAGHPGEATFDDLVFPADADTLGTTATSGVRTFRTGSNLTARCVSRYGVQDLSGNVWEWATDQCMSASATSTCTGTNGLGGPPDSAFVDIPISEALGGGTDSFLLQSVPQWLPVLGLPAAGDAPAWYGAAPIPASGLRGDAAFVFANSNVLKGLYTGGCSTSSTRAGRYAFNVSEAPTHSHPRIGFRCMMVVP